MGRTCLCKVAKMSSSIRSSSATPSLIGLYGSNNVPTFGLYLPVQITSRLSSNISIGRAKIDGPANAVMANFHRVMGKEATLCVVRVRDLVDTVLPAGEQTDRIHLIQLKRRAFIWNGKAGQ